MMLAPNDIPSKILSILSVMSCISDRLKSLSFKYISSPRFSVVLFQPNSLLIVNYWAKKISFEQKYQKNVLSGLLLHLLALARLIHT